MKCPKCDAVIPLPPRGALRQMQKKIAKRCNQCDSQLRVDRDTLEVLVIWSPEEPEDEAFDPNKVIL